MPVSSWSTNPNDNSISDIASGINWSENMAPGQVNDSARAVMAEIKKKFNDIDGSDGSLEITHASDPSLWFHVPGAVRKRWYMDAVGSVVLRDHFGQNHFYVTAAGAVWTQELGDLNSRIEARASAWAATREAAGAIRPENFLSYFATRGTGHTVQDQSEGSYTNSTDVHFYRVSPLSNGNIRGGYKFMQYYWNGTWYNMG